jgi:uroporphyrinogen-III decarboxylase
MTTAPDGIPALQARTLTPKERMVRALTGQKPDRLPAAPAYLSLFLADFERAFYVEQYRQRLRGRSRYSIDHDEDTLLRAQAIYQSYGVFKARPDWIEVHGGPGRDWAEQTDVVEEDGVLFFEDWSTGRRTPVLGEKSSLTDLWDSSAQIRGRSDIDAELPILTAEELLASGEFDLLRQVVADYGDRYFITTILDTPFSDAYDLLGFQGLMVIQHDQPELFHYMLERKLAQSQEVMAACAACGIQGVYAEEVFTGADLISPRSYDQFVYRYNLPYFRQMRSLGLLPIHYVCGNSIPRLERMVEYDVAAVAVEESKKGFQIEIDEVVEQVAGRTAVLGNIDAVQFGLHATADEMAAEVRRQAAIGARAKGFVVSTGSPFPLDTNPRLIDTLVETAHSVAGYG